MTISEQLEDLIAPLLEKADEQLKVALEQETHDKESAQALATLSAKLAPISVSTSGFAKAIEDLEKLLDTE